MPIESSSPAQTRARIIEVASELLATSTSGEISTREICEAAEVKAPTLYHHFGDKDGLLQAAATDGFERYLARKRALEQTGDLVADFRRAWDTHVEFGVSNPALYRVMHGRTRSGQPVPAAEAAHADLVGAMREIEDAGRLRLPVEVAADVVDAAAVGTILHLIRTRGGTGEPMAGIVRDTVTAAVMGPARSYSAAPATPQLARAAARLDDVLPHGPVGALRASETALMHEWLADLTDSGNDRATARHD